MTMAAVVAALERTIGERMLERYAFMMAFQGNENDEK